MYRVTRQPTCPMNPARQHPSLSEFFCQATCAWLHTSAYPSGQPCQAAPFHPRVLQPGQYAPGISSCREAMSRPAAGIPQPSKPRSDSSQQPSAAAASGKASESGNKGTTAYCSCPSRCPATSRVALQQSPARVRRHQAARALAPAKQSAAPGGTSMSQTPAKMHDCRQACSAEASQPAKCRYPDRLCSDDWTILARALRVRGADESRRVEPESKNQRKRRQREEAQASSGCCSRHPAHSRRLRCRAREPRTIMSKPLLTRLRQRPR